VLAHVADIPQLKQAFADGLDIHAMTASEMFGVPVEGMPSEVRRRAKAINFGIIYGISAFGLANQLGIRARRPATYIKKYFERFPGIRDYMDATQGQVAASMAMSKRSSAGVPLSRNQFQSNPSRARLQRARRDQRADPGQRRRHHPPRHDPHGATLLAAG
jgi:DNA polymerase I-like protein with 3'-5' exonuclease and polymerase domains